VVTSDGRREPSIEGTGCGAELASGRAEGSDSKKRVEFAGLREDLAFAQSGFWLSERTACKLLGVDRSSYRYVARPGANSELRTEMVKLAWQKPRLARANQEWAMESIVDGLASGRNIRILSVFDAFS
jgi:hypothetical protein